MLVEAKIIAHKLSSGPSKARAVTKDALDREADMTMQDALKLEAKLQAQLMRDINFKEAYHAFTEKRKPRFE